MSADLKPYRVEPIALSNESTVVAEFQPDSLSAREATYQSEAELEKTFIQQLQAQAYEYLSITSEVQLIANLRRQLERLNKVTFSNTEWHCFFSTCIASTNDGISEKTARIQVDHVQALKRDDGTFKNIYLFDKANIHNNALQVINQYESEGARATRFDATVLVNGLPMVHIELKRRGVDIRKAFNLNPGLFAHQSHSQFGQDLRQHRFIPQSGAGDQRCACAVRQQGCQRHRTAQALRRVLHGVRKTDRGAGCRVRIKPTHHRRVGTEGIHQAVRRDPAAEKHPHGV